MRLDAVARYGALGASSRIRLLQYVGALHSLMPGLDMRTDLLLPDVYLAGRYDGRITFGTIAAAYLKRAARWVATPAPDIRWVEKELWPYLPAWLERLTLARRPYVLDIDDAVFHIYDTHSNPVVRLLLGRKIDRLLAGAALVTAGNEYLAERARAAGARWVEIVPTVVDLDHYPLAQTSRVRDDEAALRICWIGSPGSIRVFSPAIATLQRLAARRRIQLRMIGVKGYTVPGVEVLCIPWSEGTEAHELAQCDVGIMPLADTPWERGKCGYKLIQYFACGLPVVASPVGVNKRIVASGVNGFLAIDESAWLVALETLGANRAMRVAMGRAGRALVEREYSVQATAPRLAQWFGRISARPSGG